MRMYGLLADVVVVAHFALLALVTPGSLLPLRCKRAPWLHVPAPVWCSWVELTGRMCPLTPLENRLRHAAGAGAYACGLIQHYLLPIIYPAGLTHPMQIALGVALILGNVAIYVWIVRRWRRAVDGAKPSGPPGPSGGSGPPG